jgi:beta-phosphoglucomutase
MLSTLTYEMRDFMFEAVIFDMDGVLVNSESLDHRAWTEVLRKHGVHVEPSELRHLVGKPTQLVLQYFSNKAGRCLPSGIIEEKREMFYNIANHGIGETHGVRAFLSMLEERQIPLALASASEPQRIEIILTRTRLKKFFCVLESGESVAHNKPAPDVYLRVSNQLGVTPAKCLVIEDSATGVEAARRAGMTVWGYTSTLTDEALLGAGADLTFDSFQEAVKLFVDRNRDYRGTMQ